MRLTRRALRRELRTYEARARRDDNHITSLQAEIHRLEGVIAVRDQKVLALEKDLAERGRALVQGGPTCCFGGGCS